MLFESHSWTQRLSSALMRLRQCLLLIGIRIAAVCLLCLIPLSAHAQVYINHIGNDICAPGDSFTITMSTSLPTSNPTIWVNGVAHPGMSYTIQTTEADNPREYLYYGTVTVNYGPTVINWDSRKNTTQQRPGDLICINSHITDISFLDGYALYERSWSSQDGTLHGRDISGPTILNGYWSSPVCYQRSSTMEIYYGTNGMGDNNGVTVEGQADLSLMKGTTEVWHSPPDWIPCTTGFGFSVTTPALPDYIYTYTLQHVYKLSVVFAYQPPAPQQRERRVLGSTSPVTTKVYAVFADPNTTFPPYHRNDVVTSPKQNIPWCEIIEATIAHITQDGVISSVTTEADAMARLTTDLYVFSNRPNGPSNKALYDSDHANYYGTNIDPSSTELRFDLWSMKDLPHGDCRDFAAFLECHAKSIGISNVQKIRLSGPFNYKPLMNCGTNVFVEKSFDYHQIVYVGTNVYDWAVGFQSGGTPPWTLALNYTKTQEINAIVKSAGSVNWTNAFSLGSADPNVGNLPTVIGRMDIP